MQNILTNPYFFGCTIDKNYNNIYFMSVDKLHILYYTAIDIFSLCSKPGNEKDEAMY